TYEPTQVASYLAAATRAALVLAELRAPFRGRSTPVNAWWGSFDLAVSLSSATLSPPQARWESALGEYILDWEDVLAAPDPHAAGVEFARSAFRHACQVCDWDPALAASAEGRPPPVQ